MKTATITWLKYNNFGTFLQAYALQQYIVGLGIENCILDDSHIVEPRKKTIRGRLGRLKYEITKWLRKRICFRERLYNKLFENFRKRYLTVDYNTIDLSVVDKKYDCFICGSDQIWNPGPIWLTQLNSSFYYAGFTKKKRIAYAPSFGVTTYPEKHKKEFVSYIRDFSALSAREDVGCKIIESLIGKKAICTLDPTFLLNEVQWRHLIGEKKRKPYVLGYFLTENAEYNAFAQRYASNHNLEYKQIYQEQNKSTRNKNSLVCGPLEFLKAIDNASVVLTDSFHGTVFSIMFRTPNATFQRFFDKNAGQNERLINLFSIIKANRLLINSSNLNLVESYLDFDFENARKELDSLVIVSKQFLKDALEI